MRAIAAAARVQPAAIYHWYPSKEAILVQLQDDFMEQLDRQGRGRDGPAGARPRCRLAAAVREHVVFHGLHRAEAFVTDSEIRALRPGPRRALIAKRDAYQEIFRELIRAGVADGSLHATDAEVATYAILLAVHGGGAVVRPGRPAQPRARSRSFTSSSCSARCRRRPS